MHIPYEERTKSGDVYWDIKPYNILLKNIKKVTVHFDHLFNGDKTLGKKRELHLRSVAQVDCCIHG
jgi:hypothetical protein